MMNDTICPPDSICLIRLSAIGDVCHVTAVVQGIQSRYPETKITWIIGRVEYELLRDLPGVEFVVFDKGQGLAAYRDVRKKLEDREPFDLLLHMQTSLRSNLLALLINAHKKIGFPRTKSKELHGFVINAQIQDQSEFHVLDVFKGFAHFVGVDNFEPQWNIPMPSPAVEKAIALIPKDKGAVVIAPSASNPERNWLPERYAEVADFCVDKGFDVIVTGGPASSDVEMANSICRQTRHAPINMAGQTNLKELLAICTRARLVIGPDSGTLHMATTQSTPVVGLYAHSNPQRTGPYLSLNNVVDVYNSSLDALGIPPEKRRWGLRLKGKNLMRAISVPMVIDSIAPFLEYSDVQS
jgi:heptosyltransferase I